MDPIRSDIVAIQGYGISMIGGRPENQDDWGLHGQERDCCCLA